MYYIKELVLGSRPKPLRLLGFPDNFKCSEPCNVGFSAQQQK